MLVATASPSLTEVNRNRSALSGLCRLRHSGLRFVAQAAQGQEVLHVVVELVQDEALVACAVDDELLLEVVLRVVVRPLGDAAQVAEGLVSGWYHGPHGEELLGGVVRCEVRQGSVPLGEVGLGSVEQRLDEVEVVLLDVPAVKGAYLASMPMRMAALESSAPTSKFNRKLRMSTLAEPTIASSLSTTSTPSSHP